MKTIKFLILLLHNAQESRGGFPWNRIFLSAPDDKVWHVGLNWLSFSVGFTMVAFAIEHRCTY